MTYEELRAKAKIKEMRIYSKLIQEWEGDRKEECKHCWHITNIGKDIDDDYYYRMRCCKCKEKNKENVTEELWEEIKDKGSLNHGLEK
ncbi:MAG: hypothetical protein ACTSSK_03570 [Candidatus Heimdallarchaeota archaeon]